jgi:hypothetical protein
MVGMRDVLQKVCDVGVPTRAIAFLLGGPASLPVVSWMVASAADCQRRIWKKSR